MLREDKAKSQAAYLPAKKNRPLDLDRDGKRCERAGKRAGDGYRVSGEAESAKRQALKAYPSRAYAEGGVFAICSIQNTIGPVFIGQYLSRADFDVFKTPPRFGLKTKAQPMSGQ